MDFTHNPVDQFNAWLDEARDCPEIEDATAMALATVDESSMPWVRYVLLKAADERGFSFYTNLQSPKASHLAANPCAALCFYWEPLGRQIRIQGRVEPVDGNEADAYFATRPRESQIGAWASRQSQPLSGRDELEARIADFDRKFEGGPVPRPEFWSGFRLVPARIEFWKRGEFRLHERIVYTRNVQGWTFEQVYP